MNKKVHKLVLNEPNDRYLLGIVSNDNDYRLSWQINDSLGILLNRAENIQISMKDELHDFVRYDYLDEDKYIQYTLFKNKSSNNTYLIPEQKSCDFLLSLQGSLFENEYDKIKNSIKKIAGVSMTFDIDMASLKSKKNLAFL